ncbi:hypothetical protein HNY73_011291 [Argiope bruennichi]|uniref:DDE Tnp4 domain-containing protein n=1 Tax=Argiope bruennichi TaxID=94029 RepID=A0A8T0F3M3_ARGBR|nr:hypothetical protein HNY73_011291 [Argiope bruennichi]
MREFNSQYLGYKFDRSIWNQQTVILMKKTLLQRLQNTDDTEEALYHLSRCDSATLYATFGSYGYFGEIFAKIRFHLMYTEYVINTVYGMIRARERIADAAELEQYPCTSEQIERIQECFLETKKCVQFFMSTIEQYFWGNLAIEQQMTVSFYKKTNTLKDLIVVMPSGAISFISPLYCGSIFDMELFTKSHLMDVLEPNDVMMAD